jgi:TolA-binding protein
MRSTLMAIGDCLYKAGRYSDAVGTYTMVAERYSDRPEALDAYVQIANCYRATGRTTDARSVLRQARSHVNKIPDKSFQQQATNLTKSQWDEWLQWAIEQ